MWPSIFLPAAVWCVEFVRPWGPFPGQFIVLFAVSLLLYVTEQSIVAVKQHMTPTLSFCRLPFLCGYCPLCARPSSSFYPPPLPSLNIFLLTANQRAGKAVDPAGGWVLWQGPRPCPGNKEMGFLGGQALQRLLYPYGQIPNLPGNGAGHLVWLKQGCEWNFPETF